MKDDDGLELRVVAMQVEKTGWILELQGMSRTVFIE